ncbi:LytTR family DNA-binding domain-containing protein [Paenibacillus qinlingensis]|uniref:DNA-binding LytR/AlgR family response regulator n=1 Tax=Paenibacillus qinlingensis TaxID=1837343 RepID=A0ABU1P6V6_9BACL|nr:DNA-binding LytR/AlgR family response regulator [Paenibacillus qinlingensis]
MYVIGHDNAVYDIDEADIICIEVQRPTVIYRTLHGTFRRPRTVKEHVQIYGPLGFMQIDKNKVTNLKIIEKYSNGEVHYTNGLTYPISRRRVNEVRKYLLKNSPK